jgi:hypothetical protein
MLPRSLRAGERDRLAIKANHPFVVGECSCQDLHQRAFACAVGADEAVNFAPLEREIDAIQRQRRAKAFRDRLALEQVRARRNAGSRSH